MDVEAIKLVKVLFHDIINRLDVLLDLAAGALPPLRHVLRLLVPLADCFVILGGLTGLRVKLTALRSEVQHLLQIALELHL